MPRNGIAQSIVAPKEFLAGYKCGRAKNAEGVRGVSLRLQRGLHLIRSRERQHATRLLTDFPQAVEDVRLGTCIGAADREPKIDRPRHVASPARHGVTLSRPSHAQPPHRNASSCGATVPADARLLYNCSNLLSFLRLR